VTSADSPLAAAPGDSEYLANVRHELRTPMHHIIGYSEVLMEEAEDHGQSRYVPDLKKIHLAGEHLLGLINDLLNPSQIEAAQRGMDAEAFWRRTRHELRTPLNQIIGYSEMLQEEMAEGEVAHLLPDLETIHSAARHLADLINDLLTPARMAAGVWEHRPEAPHRPLSESGREDANAVLQPQAKRPEAEHGLLLVVDDNKINRDMLTRRLERQGYTIRAVENGRQALRIAAEQKFDLILLDVMMPEMDGYQTLARLKADPRFRDIPVIMISALDEIESIVRCIEMGAEDYLPKPFDPVLLRARIGASLEKKRLRDQEQAYLQQIAAEKKRADDLLHVILPDTVVDELKATNRVKPRRYENVAVMFCDIVDFTIYCDQRPPEQVVAYLQELVETFEALAARYGLEKIKTVGDAFMTTAGLLKPIESPVLSCVKCGLEMIAAAPRLSAGWKVRAGIHWGTVIAGVVGHRHYLFDVWGDTVNTAARVEGLGVPDRVNISGEAWKQVSGLCRGVSRGFVRVKGKGEMEMFLVEGLTT